MFRSSTGNFRDFIEGSVWSDMKQEMEVLLDNVKDTMTEAREIEEIYRCQGRAEVLRDLMRLPENILLAIEEGDEEDED